MAIRKNTSGSFAVDVYDQNKKRIVKTFAKKSDAIDYETKTKNEKREVRLINSDLKKAEVLFSEALLEFKNSKNNLSKKTVQKYSFIVTQFQEFADTEGIINLSDFNSDNATRLLQVLRKGKYDSDSKKTITPKAKTINGFLLFIKAFFKEEEIKGRIVKSPMVHLKNLKEENIKPEFYTKEELKSFFAQEMNSSYRLIFQGLLYTGMRINELANVKWSDVDFDKKVIRVSRKDGFVPKTDNAERAIPINDKLLSSLNDIKEGKDWSAYVFTSPRGDKLRERYTLTVCKDIAELAGISGRAFLHKFRHTFATHLVMNRVPIERVQKLLGHSSINETLIYAHLIPDDMHEDVSVLNNLV
ncbi:MAG: tyrosine-type recombinase/integrase [Ignavibacteriaceae bacterium]|nr:tyrosine-type recombinase/integrase [Ignavibacteriaceae bacterium]